MYRPSMYNKHDESMYAFVELSRMMKKLMEMMDILFIAMVKKSVMIGNIETDIFQIAGCSLIHWDNTKEN